MVKLPLEAALEECLKEAGMQFSERIYPEEVRRKITVERLKRGERQTGNTFIDSAVDVIYAEGSSQIHATLDDGYDFFYRELEFPNGFKIDYWATINERNIKQHALIADELVKSGKILSENVITGNTDSYALIQFKPVESYTSVSFDFIPDKDTTPLELSIALDFLRRAVPVLTPLQGNATTPQMIAEAIVKLFSSFR